MNKEGSSVVWKISSLSTNNTLKAFENLSYKIAAVNKLSDNDRVRRLQFPTWAAREREILFNIWLSDKVCFHLNGTVSEWNIRFWGMEPTENFHGKSSLRGKISALVAMSSHSLLAQSFLNETVNSERYLHILQNDFLPQLVANSACLYIHSGLCKIVSHCILQILC
jgi:hypothetical protein